jgi:Ni,Fe-hydrogenase III component G
MITAKKTKEEILKEKLETNFNGKITDITIRRSCRVYCMAKGEDIFPITQNLIENLGFDYLCTITGVDCGDTINMLYHWGHKDGILLTVEAAVPVSKPEVQSITPLMHGAVYYERELVDMLGIDVKGLPDGNRYPLPDGFPADQHPLRKSWDAAKYIKDNEPVKTETGEDNLCQK